MPDLAPQRPVNVTGFKPEIDASGWLTVKATHQLGDGGYTTRAEFELGSASADSAGPDEDT